MKLKNGAKDRGTHIETKTGKRVMHGTPSANAYQNYGCRCDRCTRAWTDYHMNYLHRAGYYAMTHAERSAELRKNVKHGSATMYGVMKCRCGQCRAWSRNARQEARDRQRSKPVPRKVHGTLNGYDNWGCRCKRCSAVKTVAGRARYLKKKAQTNGR